MSTGTSNAPDTLEAPAKVNLAALTFLRPAEIKTYHRQSYARLEPSTTLDGSNKTVLVTGGASGIGFAISESFAKAGVERLVLIQRRQEVLAKAKSELEAKYPKTKVATYAASVTDFDRISSILKEIGKIDILVPNVAASHPFAPSKDITTADFKTTFDTNVTSVFHIIREFLALASPGPRVVINVSSASGQLVQPGNTGYGPSKAAVNQVIQHFTAEYAGTDVTFQNFHPGAIYTEGASKLVPEDRLEWEDVRLPGDFAVWLASPEARFLAGRIVWAQWDVDELLTLKERLAANPALLTTTTVL